jgi:hypothetical protein
MLPSLKKLDTMIKRYQVVLREGSLDRPERLNRLVGL